MEEAFELVNNGNLIEAISKSEECLKLIQNNNTIEHSYSELYKLDNWKLLCAIDQYDTGLKYLGNALAQ